MNDSRVGDALVDALVKVEDLTVKLAESEADWAARLAAAERERDEARWSPLEDYHKQHVPACRKHMYDAKSSPCTCSTEWERLLYERDEARREAAAAESRAARLEAGLRLAINEYVNDCFCCDEAEGNKCVNCCLRAALAEQEVGR